MKQKEYPTIIPLESKDRSEKQEMTRNLEKKEDMTVVNEIHSKFRLVYNYYIQRVNAKYSVVRNQILIKILSRLYFAKVKQWNSKSKINKCKLC